MSGLKCGFRTVDENARMRVCNGIEREDLLRVQVGTGWRNTVS